MEFENWLIIQVNFINNKHLDINMDTFRIFTGMQLSQAVICIYPME